MSDQTETILRALLATAGRSAFSVEQIHAIVDPTGNGLKQVKAYNLADGTLTQGEIAKKLKLDSGNFSRTVSRWVEAGIMFRLPDKLILHVFSVPEKKPAGGTVA